MNDSDQNVDFNFGENNNYHEIGNSSFDFDITVRRADDANITNNSAIRLTNNAFAFWFKEARLSTTSGADLEHKIFVGQIATIMKTITTKDADLLSQFDNCIEGNRNADFHTTSLKKC